MTHAMITIALPFDAGRADAVDALLDKMGNPPNEAIRAALDATRAVHFMSLSAIRDTGPGRAHLLLEASADRAPDPVAAIATALHDPIWAVLQAAGIGTGGCTLATFLAAHRLTLGGGWSRTPGLAFDGSPGLSVQRIRDEDDLACRITTDMADILSGAGSATDKLRAVRDRLWQAGHKWAFVAEATPFLTGGRAISPAVVAEVAARAAGQLLWPLLPAPIVLMAVWGVWPGLLSALALLLIVGLLGVLHLRRMEAANAPQDAAPDRERLAEVQRRENHGAQNLLAAVSVMQAGWFRRLTLRVAFCFVGQGAAHVYRPGYLRAIGVIHFARWVLIPGTDRLLFFSNFSNTWESYLEDFISKAANGLTAVWSNTRGFPRARFLFGEGATDGDRFRRWARRQQIPALFWYSAYPHLTTGRIRLNAAIRRGIAAARTDAEAQDWLACFGSAPRPAFALQKPEIQTIVFGGLRHLRHSAVLVLTLGVDRQATGAWLRGLEAGITYGEHIDHDGAMTLAFSATGLTKIGLGAAVVATFPVAFQHGMAAPWRARMLGDEGDQAPERWDWGGVDEADALLTLYAPDATRLEALLRQTREAAQAHGHTVAYAEIMKPLPEHGPVLEPFGFTDGVSQPVLRDTPRARKAANADHVVEAGEFVLGYPDGRGYRPPTPTVTAGGDPAVLLPAFVDDPHAEREPFTPGGSDRRDLGCNGSFVVVRQLEQDVDGLDRWLDRTAARLGGTAQDVWGLPQAELKALLAAKMVGRWKDGTSLVRHAHKPVGGTPDNDFGFAREDPQGLRCPLGAHMRRANPRDSLDADSAAQRSIVNRHRLLRVGRQYAAQPGGKPGLLFTCLNADIERQFEFVQQTWLLGRNFHGLLDETDPSVGTGDRVFTIPTRQGPVRLAGLTDFVRMRGGGYFFLPSRSAVRFLARLGGVASVSVAEPSPASTELAVAAD